jgi:hypothetical protein
MAEVDYGYGSPQPDYGYGEDPKPAEVDYGYGDDAPVTDYGYGDDEAAAPQEQAAAAKSRRPKRRCSVTKYSLVATAQTEGAPEAEMVKQLHAAEMLQHFRNGTAPSGTKPPRTDSGMSTTETVATSMSVDFSDNGLAAADSPVLNEAGKDTKAGSKFSRLRKRLSIFHN